MKFKILILLFSLLLVACKDEPKKELDMVEPVPEVTESDPPADDEVDSDEDDIDDETDGSDDDQNGDPGEPDSENPPSSDIPPEEDTTTYSDQFWLDFDCGESCQSANLSSNFSKSSYAQVELSMKPSNLDSIHVTEISSESVVSNIDTRYLANDIRVESLGDGLVKVTNNTSRWFSSILVMWSTDAGSAPLKIVFDNTLKDFSSRTYSGVPDGDMEYVETAPILNADISYRGQTEACEEPREGDESWACVRHPTHEELESLKTLSANVKWFMNTYHFPDVLDSFAFGQKYMGYAPQEREPCSRFGICESNHSVSETILGYLFSLASNGHRLNVGKLETYKKGWVGLGGGRTPIEFWGEGRSGFVSLAKVKEVFRGNYVTYMHELGHALGYGHQTGFTYGFPHYAANYVDDLLGGEQIVESVPPEVFLSKGWRDGNLYLKVYAADDLSDRKLKLQGLSMTKFSARAYVSKNGSTIKVEFSDPPKQRFLARLFSGQSDLVMTKDVAPGMLMLDKRSSEDLLVINDDIFNEIIAKESLLRSGIDKSPKKLETLCAKLFRLGDTLAIPSADELTMLSGNSFYYDNFKSEPFYSTGGGDGSDSGTFNFETLVFTKTPVKEPLETINLGCTVSI